MKGKFKMTNTLKGKIITLSSEKSVIVEIERYFTHPLYKKRIRRHKKYLVHYEGKELQVGDTVEIMETKPISKRKHFRIKA